MRVQHLQTRFFLAGSLLAMITVGCGFWSAWTFARLSRVVDQTLYESQTTIDLAAALSDSLEREDDALLLALSGDAQGADHLLQEERRRGDLGYEKLRGRLAENANDELATVAEVRGAIGDYRAAGAILVKEAGRADSLKRYHDQVNPLLRRAIRACGEIRERHFSSMRLAGVKARDEARAATRIVITASLAALLVATLVAVWLARSVVRPIGMLTFSVEAIRRGEFDHRLEQTSDDELGRLASGFNRMAETLAEYRRSSLGELLTAKMTLESTLEALPDAVFVIAPDGLFAATNSAARAILRSKGVADARRLLDLPLGQTHREAVAEALAGRSVLPSRTDFGQVIQARLNDEPRKFLVTAVPIPEFTPQRTGAVIVFDDVTEFALLDELRSELVAVASHELKTPLTTLRMNLLLLGEATDAFTARQREMLEAALLGCEELGSTTDELLDVARIEAGQLRLDLAPVDLNAILDSALRLLHTRIEDAEVKLEVRREARPAIVRGDPARLRIVMTNLLANALKYSPRGGRIVVEIVFRQDGGADGPLSCRFAVTDAGPGVPEAFRDRVFEKFFRVEHQLDRGTVGVRGTGIGLYLCREIIKAHGGSVWCDAGQGGVGTVVGFRLKFEV